MGIDVADFDYSLLEINRNMICAQKHNKTDSIGSLIQVDLLLRCQLHKNPMRWHHFLKWFIQLKKPQTSCIKQKEMHSLATGQLLLLLPFMQHRRRQLYYCQIKLIKKKLLDDNVDDLSNGRIETVVKKP